MKGQGPEHSSARLERFLQMCAEDNMQVANCTTPANYFHILRRQLKREIRKPLILMTPKIAAAAQARDFAAVRDGRRTRPSTACCGTTRNISKARRSSSSPTTRSAASCLCSGKVYFDLYEEREKRGINDIYIMRVEQLYPFPTKALIARIVALQAGRDRLVPGRAAQHGSWFFVDTFIRWVLEQIGAKYKQPRYAGRPASAATATGLMSKHLAQLKQMLDEALG